MENGRVKVLYHVLNQIGQWAQKTSFQRSFNSDERRPSSINSQTLEVFSSPYPPRLGLFNRRTLFLGSRITFFRIATIIPPCFST
jgi:hypothetical protein